jgi:hypothetical protein
MKRRIQGQHFRNKDDLWNALNEIWSALTPSFVRNYIDSMPKRIAAVIAAKGGVTRY